MSLNSKRDELVKQTKQKFQLTKLEAIEKKDKKTKT